MPAHDWTRVEAGIFHAFHHEWISEISRALNRGLLPPEYYALPEQIAGGLGPDVLTLQHPSSSPRLDRDPSGGVALATSPPKVRYRFHSEQAEYAAKAKVIRIRHVSDHRVIAMVEIISPGNKNSREGVNRFVAKALELLRTGVHLLILDLFPPGKRDQEGINRLICDELLENDYALTSVQPPSFGAYIGGLSSDAFLEPFAVGALLPEMPLFLSTDVYIPIPLEATYQSAWETVPAYWRDVVAAPT